VCGPDDRVVCASGVLSGKDIDREIKYEEKDYFLAGIQGADGVERWPHNRLYCGANVYTRRRWGSSQFTPTHYLSSPWLASAHLTHPMVFISELRPCRL
jgi:hypothetical protein